MLRHKRVIVTGANGTLGKAVVDKVQSYGAYVVGFDISFEKSSGTSRRVDLLSSQDIQQEVDSFGDVDGLLNIAGGFAMGALAHQTDLKEWDDMQAMNVTTLRNMLATVVPIMLNNKAGSIVNVGALSAERGQDSMSAYVASKSNVMRITESLSEETKGKGINVNAVLPSIIDTPANREAMPDLDFRDWVTPASIAEVMCFLISDRAKAINGALIPLSGIDE
ncbi:MAG: SDR family NAD(P)-dependent oxidoreductase [Pseudomonadota bacterium]|nr:SDR family NAD(P)-dependent oxidoreductase [Pseudomonadota bacterium]